MGYDREKIVEANHLKAVGEREVKKFWTASTIVLGVIAVVISVLVVLALVAIFSPTASLPPKEQKVGEAGRENIPRFIPPFLNRQPAPPLQWEKRRVITPIHWRDWNPPRFYNPYDSCSPTAIYDYSRGRYVIVQSWWCSDRYYYPDRYYHYPWIPEHRYRRWDRPRYPRHHHHHHPD